jgi:energy-converting hydrogenase Eha subunit G
MVLMLFWLLGLYTFYFFPRNARLFLFLKNAGVLNEIDKHKGGSGLFS